MARRAVPKYQGVYYRESAQKKGDRCFDIAYTLPNGKLKWEKVGWTSEGYTAQMAATIRGDRIQALRHGDELPKKKQEITFGEIWKKYSEWMTKASAADDRLRYNKHLKKRFANKTLPEISPFELERMKHDLLKQDLSPATVKHCLVLVRQIINKAAHWNLWQGDNPVKKVKIPKLNNNRERFLSRVEAELLLSELAKISRQVHDMTLLSLYTGMRAGEIFSLRWIHLDFHNGLIHIADPKGGQARKAFMTDTVKGMLKKWKPEHEEPNGYVFIARTGGRIGSVSDTFCRVADKLFNTGIDDPRQRVCFHTCRHSFASWLALGGTPLLTLKELLGHKSINMTMRYAHLIPDQKREAVNQLEQYLSSKEPESKEQSASA